MGKKVLFIGENLDIYEKIIDEIRLENNIVDSIIPLTNNDLIEIKFQTYDYIIIDYSDKIERFLDTVSYHRINNKVTEYLILVNEKKNLNNFERCTILLREHMLKKYRYILENFEILGNEKEAIKEPQEKLKIGSKNIIIIENNEEYIEILKRLLNNEDYNLMIFNNCIKAFADIKGNILNDGTVRLVILNFNIPGVTGYKFIELMKNDNETRDIPIIVTTDEINKNDIIKVAKLGIKDYLGKPLNRGLFVKKVNKILEK